MFSLYFQFPQKWGIAGAFSTECCQSSRSQSNLIQSFLSISGPVQIQVPCFRGRHLAKVWWSVALPRGAPAGGADGWRDAVLWGEHRPHGCHRILWIQISECPCVVSALTKLQTGLIMSSAISRDAWFLTGCARWFVTWYHLGGLSWKLLGTFQEILGRWLEETKTCFSPRKAFSCVTKPSWASDQCWKVEHFP